MSKFRGVWLSFIFKLSLYLKNTPIDVFIFYSFTYAWSLTKYDNKRGPSPVWSPKWFFFCWSIITIPTYNPIKSFLTPGRTKENLCNSWLIKRPNPQVRYQRKKSFAKHSKHTFHLRQQRNVDGTQRTCHNSFPHPHFNQTTPRTAPHHLSFIATLAKLGTVSTVSLRSFLAKNIHERKNERWTSFWTRSWIWTWITKAKASCRWGSISRYSWRWWQH